MAILSLEYVLMALMILTAALYIGFTIFNFRNLPTFIIFENILWALLYIIGFLILYYKGIALPVTATAAFNAGRVSNAIITSRGELGELALQHVPLLALLIVVLLLSTYFDLMRG